jgi:hypothetical protein
MHKLQFVNVAMEHTATVCCRIKGLVLLTLCQNGVAVADTLNARTNRARDDY